MKRLPPAAKVLLRCLNARQFGLKLIANVTYGYTSAGFSGDEQVGGQKFCQETGGGSTGIPGLHGRWQCTGAQPQASHAGQGA